MDEVKAVERDVRLMVESSKTESLRRVSEARARRDSIFRRKRALAEEKVKAGIEASVSEAQAKAQAVLQDSESRILLLKSVDRSRLEGAVRLVLSELGVRLA